MDSLPVELLMKIFSFITFKDYLRLLQIKNRKIEQALKDQFFLKKIATQIVRNEIYMVPLNKPLIVDETPKTLIIKKNMLFDKNHGPYIEFEKDTKIIRKQGKYSLGIKVGEWETWNSINPRNYHFEEYNDQGQIHGKEIRIINTIFYEMNWENGLKNGPYSMSVNLDTLTIPMVYGSYKDNLRDNIWTFFNANHIELINNEPMTPVLKKGSYKKGRKHGEWKYYIPNQQGFIAYITGTFDQGIMQNDFDYSRVIFTEEGEMFLEKMTISIEEANQLLDDNDLLFDEQDDE